MNGSPMRLNLGCGRFREPGWTNVDIIPYRGVDVVWDLRIRPWPWADNSIDEIGALDLIEHLDDFMGFFNEAWRVLKPGGTVFVKVPRSDHPHMWTDPTHKRPFTVQSFEYLTPNGFGAKYEYTDRKWVIIDIQDGVDIYVRLSPVKAVAE